MAPVFEYFVVCGVGPNIKTLEGSNGYYGMKYKYDVSLIDQFPSNGEFLYPELPPELPKCVLPAGLDFFASGFDVNEFSSYPRSYPVVLTVGNGSKLYVSCIVFRDPVDEDIAEAYGIPSNTYAEKSISLVSRLPCFRVLGDALEEIFSICFSPEGSQKPLWEVIKATILNVPLPTPGQDRVLFSVNNYLLSLEAPPEYGLPHADVFSIDACVRSDMPSNISISVAGVDFVDAPTPYIIGLHSSVDTSDLLMDGVVIVDIDHNFIITSEEIPPIPEPELHTLHSDIMNLLYPNLLRIDEISFGFGLVYEKCPPVKLWGEDHDLKLRSLSLYGKQHRDKAEYILPLRLLIFLKFFAKLLSGYRSFIGNTSDYPFNDEAFILERSQLNNELPDAMIRQFLGSQGFSNYIGRVVSDGDSNVNVLDKLIDATRTGQDLMSIFPSSASDPIIITIPDPTNRIDQEAQLILDIKAKLKGLWFSLAKLEAADVIVSSDEYETILGVFSCTLIETDSQGHVGSAFIEGIREHMNSGWNCKLSEKLFIAVKELVKGVIIRAFSRNDMRTVRDALEVSAEIYRNDLNGVPDYIQRHLLSLSIWENIGTCNHAILLMYLEIDQVHHCPVAKNVKGHFVASPHAVGHLSEVILLFCCRSSSKENLILSQLMLVALHMGGLGVPDTIAWPVIEYLAQTNYIDFDLYVQLRGYLSYIHQLHIVYWGISDSKVQSSSLHSMQLEQDVIHDSQQPAIELGTARNWVRSMFGKEAPIVVNPSSHGQGLATDSEISGDVVCRGDISMYFVAGLLKIQRKEIQKRIFNTFGKPFGIYGHTCHNPYHCSATTLTIIVTNAALLYHEVVDVALVGEIGSPRRHRFANSRQRRIQSNVRVIRGHDSTVTALHCVTKREVWDLVADREDSGFFFTGSTDCSVKIWDPSRRGLELVATMKGHTGVSFFFSAVRAISSDRQKVVSGSDDLSILVWDKNEFILLEELKSHQAPISYVRMLSGERVLSSSHDGTVKMWDARIGSCIATVAHCPGAVLCTEYDDSTGILAAAGRDSVVHIWDIRAGRHVHKLQGHTKWVRSIRMDGDRVITGSDDWTARIWSISRGECDAVLAHHAGPIRCVDFSEPDNGIITGSDDGSVRFWENADNSIKCSKEMNLNSSILSINVADEWLGIGTADNSMLLFNQPEAKKSQGWQLYKTPKAQAQAAVVRCVASDLEHKRMCSGGRDGVLRIWDATVNI
ncbi:hypothetical protein KSS87_023807 [Heliosperma pusillum]|nr:hypothetical protein KSS87_023807 [Heliosperma pusillum]